MGKRIAALLILACTFVAASCLPGTGGIQERRLTLIASEEAQADARAEQIISAIMSEDREDLKSLFSQNALDEAVDIDSGIDFLFDFIQGDIVSWERDGLSGSRSTRDGRTSLMNRFAVNISTYEDDYVVFVMDYSTDTINPDNQGIYMLEIRKSTDNAAQRSWQERMRAGIHRLE